MKVQEITLSVGRTFNLGSFESGRFDVQVRIVLDEGQTIEDATTKMLPAIRKSLLLAYQDHVDKRGHGKDL